MTDITLNPITSGYNLSKINANFDVVEDVINDEVLHTVGGNNTMQQDLDLNGFNLLNVSTLPNDPDSILTVGAGDVRYYNITGDTLEGPMNVAGFSITNIAAPVVASNPVRKVDLDNETTARAAADAALADQIIGGTPASSQFSPVSWHPQTVTNSVTIPANMNGWSFGPTLSIASGQFVTIGSGSFWTIAEGTLVP
jgi:hypothetical protein